MSKKLCPVQNVSYLHNGFYFLFFVKMFAFFFFNYFHFCIFIASHINSLKFPDNFLCCLFLKPLPCKVRKLPCFFTILSSLIFFNDLQRFGKGLFIFSSKLDVCCKSENLFDSRYLGDVGVRRWKAEGQGECLNITYQYIAVVKVITLNVPHCHWTNVYLKRAINEIR